MQSTQQSKCYDEEPDAIDTESESDVAASADSIQATPPDSSPQAALRDAVSVLLEDLAPAVLERIQRVNEMTECEVLAASNALQAVANEARAHIDDTKQCLGQIVGGADVTALISEQTRRRRHI